MTTIGSYQVKVRFQLTGENCAVVSPAQLQDMPNHWTFDWPGLWKRTDFDCQNIIKLVYSEQVWGLARYGIYPYPYPPQFLEIEQLEANPTSQGESNQRLIEPIGKWLIWYCTKVGLQYCSGTNNDTIVTLVSLANAISYYRDVIQMEYLDAVTIAPGEDGYAFRFSRTAATAFCQRHEAQWGVPTVLD